jgi:CRP/FNR family transcriptional regulator, nitrogen fixation regulation protein
MQTAFTTTSRTPPVIALAPPMARALQASPAGLRRTFAKGERLFAEGDPSDHFYKLVSGTIRTSKLLSDGRRQIDSFHLAGDIFGLENSKDRHFSAEAIEPVVVLAFRRTQFTTLLHADPAFGEQLMSATIASLDRAHDHMVLLGRKSALEKVATFLLDLANRLSKGNSVDLPMQRADIADYLGLTIETVSRVLSQMVRDGLINLAGASRTIFLKDKAALELLAV